MGFQVWTEKLDFFYLEATESLAFSALGFGQVSLVDEMFAGKFDIAQSARKYNPVKGLVIEKFWIFSRYIWHTGSLTRHSDPNEDSNNYDLCNDEYPWDPGW